MGKSFYARFPPRDERIQELNELLRAVDGVELTPAEVIRVFEHEQQLTELLRRKR